MGVYLFCMTCSKKGARSARWWYPEEEIFIVDEDLPKDKAEAIECRWCRAISVCAHGKFMRVPKII